MREFFKPWRRKAGCVTLGLACVFAGLWFRSLTKNSDLCELQGVIVVSDEGILRFGAGDTSIHPFWVTQIFSVGAGNEKDSSGWFFVKKWGTGLVTMIELASVPHWAIVLPLTLLSAYLLLTKPRPPVPNKPRPDAPTQTTEPAQTAGERDA